MITGQLLEVVGCPERPALRPRVAPPARRVLARRARPRRPTPAPPPGADPLSGYRSLAASFRRHLLAENKSPRTVETYGEGVRLLGDFLVAEGLPTDVARLRREHVEAFVAALLARWKPATASNRYRALQVFFRWLVDEGEVEASPLAAMRPPAVPEAPPRVLDDDAAPQAAQGLRGPGVRRPARRGHPAPAGGHRHAPGGDRRAAGGGRRLRPRRGRRPGQGAPPPGLPVRPQGGAGPRPVPARARAATATPPCRRSGWASGAR